MTRIFISHSHADREIASLFVDFLLAALELRPENIRCTSVPGHQLPFGTSIGEQLKKDLNKTTGLIALITKDSLRSTWVLFELGSSWATEKLVVPILGPGLTYKDLPGPLANYPGVRIEEEDSAYRFTDVINQLALNLGVRQEANSRRDAKLNGFIQQFRGWKSQLLDPDVSQQKQIEELTKKLKESKQWVDSQHFHMVDLETQIRSLERQLEKERSNNKQLKAIEAALKQEKQQLEKSYCNPLKETKGAFPYSQLLSSSNPGLIIIMLDQSYSMTDPYQNNQNKADFAALAVNRMIGKIISACSSGKNIIDRCFVAVIGYSSDVNVLFLEKVSGLASNPKTITLKKKIPDGAGGLVEVDEILQVFVESTANGGTNTTEAFQNAYLGAEKFISSHPDSFPPIIINITDGEPNNFKTATTEANKLAQLKTSDGNVIVLNAHISSAKAGRIELPSNNDGFKNNKFAQFLFDISSVLPDNLAKRAKEVGFNVQPNAKGFVFNADAETLIKLLNFVSFGALR